MELLDEVRKASLPWFLSKPSPGVYLGDDWLVVDFETTNKDKGSALNKDNNDIVLATWADKSGVYHKFGGIYEQQELCEAVKKAKFIVCQNAKFELQWFMRLGIDIGELLVYDTMLADYVIAGNRGWRLDLDSIATRYGVPVKHSLVKTWLEAGICPSDMPRSVLLDYGLADSINERAVFLKQRKELERLGLLPVLFTRCLTCVVLADIETRGVYLDEQRVREEHTRISTRLAELELALNRITGGVNANSPKQLGEFVYDKLGFDEPKNHRGEVVRTPANGRKCDADTLSQLRATTREQEEFKHLILERQDVNKKHQTLEKLKAACDEDASVLYARFNQAVTQTHRLSSGGARRKVQFQNIPRDYKSLFRARHSGWLVGEADGAQLEFRVAAHLGRDRVAAQDIRDRVDVHRNTASALFGVAHADVTKEQRQQAKASTFQPLYGGRGFTKESQNYAKFFQERYAGIFATQTNWTYEVLESKELVTEWGMRFYWPDTTLQQRKYGKPYIINTTSIFNYPVQCFATAEIIPISLVFMWHYMKALGMVSFLVNTVHDSIIGELHPQETGLFSAIALQSLTHDTYGYLDEIYKVKFTVPLGAEVKIGTHWGEGKGESWDVEPV